MDASEELLREKKAASKEGLKGEKMYTAVMCKHTKIGRSDLIVRIKH
jgi:hypothetical protein